MIKSLPSPQGKGKERSMCLISVGERAGPGIKRESEREREGGRGERAKEAPILEKFEFVKRLHVFYIFMQ